jgi:hypothetical protein
MKSIRWDKNTIISMADCLDQQIIVNGRVWRFDFCRHTGPLWLKKDGSERRCQNPNKRVWDAFEQWRIEHGIEHGIEH